jgi:hypothetical protein
MEIEQTHRGIRRRTVLTFQSREERRIFGEAAPGLSREHLRAFRAMAEDDNGVGNSATPFYLPKLGAPSEYPMTVLVRPGILGHVALNLSDQLGGRDCMRELSDEELQTVRSLSKTITDHFVELGQVPITSNR